MKFRWWPHTTDAAIASTRLRCLLVIDQLRAQGLDAALYGARDEAPNVLVLAKRYDTASVEHARRLRQRGSRLILDICDNHFYSETDDPAWRARRQMLVTAVRAVDQVVASSAALAQTIVKEVPDSPPVQVIGDVAESPLDSPTLWMTARGFRGELELLQLRHRLGALRITRSRRLVWFGNHGSPNADGGMMDVLRARPELDELAHEKAISLTIISNDVQKFRKIKQGWPLPMLYLPWRASTFSRALRLHGVSIIPAGLNPFTRVKTSNRVATSLLHDLAVVADPIPSYQEFQDHVFLGNWAVGLRRSVERTREVASMVAGGRRVVQERYGEASIAAQWRDLLLREPNFSAD